jgi:hypothetical protein
LVAGRDVHADCVERLVRDVLHGCGQYVRGGETDATGCESGDSRRNDPFHASSGRSWPAAAYLSEGCMRHLVCERGRPKRAQSLDEIAVPVFRTAEIVFHTRLSIERFLGIRPRP